MSADDSKVHQKISGKRHQIAGRDIINYWTGFTPHPDNPNLMECYMCHRPGVSIGADVCPDCGHNFATDRERAYQDALAARQRKLGRLAWSGFALLAILVYAPGLIVGYFHISIHAAWVLTLSAIVLGAIGWLLSPVARLMWKER